MAKVERVKVAKGLEISRAITGLWQIERSQSTTFHEMVGMDIAYLDQLSVWTDFRIIMKTPLALVLALRAPIGRALA